MIALLLSGFACACDDAPEKPPEQEATERALEGAKRVGDELASERGEEAARSVARGVAKTGAAGADAVGEELTHDESAETARKLGKGIGKTFGALAEGLEEEMFKKKTSRNQDDGKLPLAVTEEAKKAGLSPQFVHLDLLQRKASAYFVFDAPFSGDLEMRVLDAKEREVGRALSAVDVAEPTGRYVDFTFERSLLDPKTFTVSIKRRPN